MFGFDLGHGDRTFDDGWFHVTQFSTYRTSNDILGHISVLIEIYKSPWSCMLISTYEVHIEMMTYLLSYHDPLVEPLWSHPIRFIFFRRLGCCHVSPSGLWIRMTRFVLLMIDDLRPFYFSNLSHIWFHTGAFFPFRSRFADPHEFAWSSSFMRYTSGWWFDFILSWFFHGAFFLSHFVRLTLSDFVVIFV